MKQFLSEEICNSMQDQKDSDHAFGQASFATTVTPSNGVPIKLGCKMLGHGTLKTTQIYAKVLDNKISKNMEKLKNDPALLEFTKSI